MALFEMTKDRFNAVETTSFSELDIKERGDLQRLLRSQINIISEELYILTEEYSGWEDSNRRIDLLAIDQDANIVVIELKRTNDGGHMDLQAIRYASMIAGMTFDQAVQIHSEFLKTTDTDAKNKILAHLKWDEPNEDDFANDVRILLVSEDFGKELTTAVLWLRDKEIDIECVRLSSYKHNGKHFVDVQKVIPLPDSGEYQIKIHQKNQEVRDQKFEKKELYRCFWSGLIAICREKNTRHGELKTTDRMYINAKDRGFGFVYVIRRESGAIELYIDPHGNRDENKRIFDQLHSEKSKIEKTFGDSLYWERLDLGQASRVSYKIDKGGIGSPEDKWPEIQSELVSSMIKFENTFRPFLASLT